MARSLRASALTMDGVQTVIDLLRPSVERTKECRLRVAETLRFLLLYSNLDDGGPPSVSKTKFEALIRASKVLRTAVVQLGVTERALLNDEKSLRELGRIIRFAEWRLIDLTGVLPGRKARTLKHSGGRKPGAAQKREAASCALDLIQGFSAAPATLTFKGLYFSLATLLYELTTGTHDADLEHACRTAFKVSKEHIDIELPVGHATLPERLSCRSRTVRQTKD